MTKWTNELDNRRIHLIAEGKSYKEVAKILAKEFSIPMSKAAVRGRSRRSQTKRADVMSGDYRTMLKLDAEIDFLDSEFNLHDDDDFNSLISNLENIRDYDEIDTDDIIFDIDDVIQEADIYIPPDSIFSKKKTSKKEEKQTGIFPAKCYDLEEKYCMSPSMIAELKAINQKLTDMKPKKILSLSDLHAPCIDFASVEKAILAHPDADICLLNGDVFDGQAMSHFDKMKEFDIDEELEQVFTLLDVLTVRFKHIIWVGGNHDLGRFLKFVMKNFSPSMKNYVLRRLNPMNYIAEKYNNLTIVPHDWVEIGDVIFAHTEKFNNVDMKTVVTNHEAFLANRHLLSNPDYRAIVIGHTHHMGKIVRNNTLLIEQGCLCHMQDYKFKKLGKIKWETGYAVVQYDDNMEIDFNGTNIYHIK